MKCIFNSTKLHFLNISGIITYYIKLLSSKIYKKVRIINTLILKKYYALGDSCAMIKEVS